MKIFIGILCVFTLCVFVWTLNEEKKVDYEKVVNELTFETAVHLQKEKHLVLIGIGGGMVDTTNHLSMSFQLHHEVGLEEARELAVYATEEFLKAINGSEELRPNLHHYPFTANDVGIWIWLKKPDRRDVPLGEICFIISKGGRVSYSIKKTEEEERLEEISDIYFLEEYYDEALSKVRASQSKED